MAIAKGAMFEQVKVTAPQSNAFDMSFENRVTVNEGFCTPIFCRPVVPGDNWSCTTSIMARLAPMVAPMMQRIDVRTEAFYVPYRQIWDEQDKYYCPADFGTSVSPVKPYFTYKDLADWNLKLRAADGSLLDFLGYPTWFKNRIQYDPNLVFSSSKPISALPLRAYAHIWNEYYRDQNLQPEIQFSHGSGHLSSTDFDALSQLRRRAWRKDYFTSALPKPQRGVDVTIPIGTTAPIIPAGSTRPANQAFQFTDVNGGIVSSPVSGNTSVSLNTTSTQLTQESEMPANVFEADSQALATVLKTAGISGFGRFSFLNQGGIGQISITDPQGNQCYLQPNFSNLVADLSNASAVTVEMLRVAEQLQKWLELNARVGCREIEQTLGHFGVRVPDLRVHRPQYLGGASTPIAISEVVQNSASADTTVGSQTSAKFLGSLGGYGFSYGNEHGFNSGLITERGVIIVIMSVMPYATYQQGLPRWLTRMDVLDEYYPEFAHLGEQEVKQSEIYFDPSVDPGLDGVFGYQSRFSDMKYIPDECHGDFKNNLSFWHQGRIFASQPYLNSQFIECNPDYRPFAVTDSETSHFWIQIYNHLICRRPMPVYGTPLN